ncbi:polymeric immunoglobulin receptor-like [Brienomyrus brachyistius]|uniref:polymeric immunoglobulin receptor-like n=1 Tax=Brienomyrus brachyistius TaxID=42636 RepID=UPI0020B3E9D1|nr:polymeric immunoglobulin receptor-like [Brienomyrus brachyistius]
MDPLMLLFLLIAGLTGADSVYTLTKVSVQIGESVTIPCFYGDGYKTHLKSWCRGIAWSACTPIVYTDSPQEAKVSVRDDPDQQVFTVTFNNLTAGDSDWYWCKAEISEGSVAGIQAYLSVTDGSPELSVDKQEVKVVEGDNVSVQCRYTKRYSKLKWCKGGGSCVAVTSRSLDGRPVLIRHDRVNKVFNVTMKGLERKDAGWYWCTPGIWQIPVHITVSQTATTTTITDQGESNDKLSSLVQLALYVGLGSLVLLLIIIIITWKVWDKHKKKIARNQHPGSRELRASEEPGADVSNSSIVLRDPEQVSSRCSSHRPAVTPASDVVTAQSP